MGLGVTLGNKALKEANKNRLETEAVYEKWSTEANTGIQEHF